MPESNKDNSPKPRSSTPSRLQSGQMTSVIGSGAQGNVVRTDDDQAVKVIPLENSDGTLKENSLREVAINIPLQNAANDHPELADSLILMKKWDVSKKSFIPEDKGDKLVFSMQLHSLAKLEGFDTEGTDQEVQEQKNSVLASLNELLPAFKKLYELGFYPDDTNLFIDKNNDKILMGDFDQFSFYSNSKASEYIESAYGELTERLKDHTEKDIPDFKSIFKSKENYNVSANITASDTTYSKNIYEMTESIDSSFYCNYSAQLLSAKYGGKTFPEKADELSSSINQDLEHAQHTPENPNKNFSDKSTQSRGRY